MSKIGQLLTYSSILSRVSQQFRVEELFVWYEVQVHEEHSNMAQWLKHRKANGRFTFRLVPWQRFACFSIGLSLQSQFGERKRVLGMNSRSNKQPLNTEYSNTSLILLWSTKISAENFCQSLFISGVYLRLRGEWLKGRCLHVWCNWVNGRSGEFWPYFIVEGRRRGKILRHVDH